MLERIHLFLQNNFYDLYIPSLNLTDILEVLIISYVVYHFLVWARKTTIWSLFRGIIMIFIFIALAVIFNMTTIIWIVKNVFGIAVIAFIVILQPELRRILEGIGRRSHFSGIFIVNSGGVCNFSDKTIDEITRASFEMAKVKTGALIVIENKDSLADYEFTGIDIDAKISSQLIINIFEHNTPLHDGAVIVRGNRIKSATCYLPLSGNLDIDKGLGTRHRAGLGVSEATDALTVIVSEETGKVSVAFKGELERGISSDRLKERLREIQNKSELYKENKIFKWGKFISGKKSDKK